MRAIEPDTKDWTWVLRERCPQCGLDSSAVTVLEVGDLVRASVPRWRAALARPDARTRPDPATWSVLEYGAHVRDVFRIFDERLALVLERDAPTFANWDQDATAVAERYDEQDPAVVADELAAAARAIADRFDAVPAAAHGRRGLRSNGSEFTVTTLAQYFWHDVAHHLHDVRA
ncbi:DinB family protein [Litorihabitans aurantiacus]|uniref:DinB-like domain-containing protein n=1 Tax=Litorihabitans aurantiacus TaxID=1930061 RepID=A0AA37UW85_9MICO|nr:DinB family protein [Litorihabitans aurantiacus]GMA30172.1 hypothetical protein GCM10025875_01640 [Litorihabitans aurantiacus]